MSDSDSDSDLQLAGGQQPPNDEEWDTWAGEEGDGDDDSTASLFDPATLLPSPEAALAHDAAQHGFDLRRYRSQRGLDDYGTIRVVNFIRREVAAGRDPRPALEAAAAAGEAAAPWAGDAFLQPVLADDPLLTYDYDGDEEEHEAGRSAAAAAAGGASSSVAAGAPAAAAGLSSQLAALSAENRELQLRLAALMEAALPPELRQELREAAAEDAVWVDSAAATTSARRGAGVAAGPSSSPSSAAAAAAAGPSSADASSPHVASGSGRGRVGGVLIDVPGHAGAGGSASCLAAAAARGRIDAAYFDSYSYFDIHHEMLSDKPRTLAYRAALTSNPGLMAGATVLDVGCGTGILSLFAARGGAAAVVGLDGSQRIAGFARQVVAANRLDAASGGPVTIVSGKVEDAPDIGHKQVSVIVSEWMGYGLLFESMLDSLLAARDRWLAPGGALLPDKACVWAAGADSSAFGAAFWQDVYGFSMAPIAAELASAAAREGRVLVRPVPGSALTTSSARVHAMDLLTMTPVQQDFTASFTLTAAAAAAEAEAQADGAGPGGAGVTLAALVVWFDVEFSERCCREHPVTLSTSPAAEPTHWAQAVLPLQQPLRLAPGGSVSCRLSMARHRSKHRCLDMSLEVTPQPGAAGAGSSQAAAQTMLYSMGVTGSD